MVFVFEMMHRLQFTLQIIRSYNPKIEKTCDLFKQMASQLSTFIKREKTDQLPGSLILRDIELFLQTGDCKLKEETDVFTCLNPTLLSLKEKIWQVREHTF